MQNFIRLVDYFRMIRFQLPDDGRIQPGFGIVAGGRIRPQIQFFLNPLIDNKKLIPFSYYHPPTMQAGFGRVPSPTSF